MHNILFLLFLFAKIWRTKNVKKIIISFELRNAIFHFLFNKNKSYHAITCIQISISKHFFSLCLHSKKKSLTNTKPAKYSQKKQREFVFFRSFVCLYSFFFFFSKLNHKTSSKMVKNCTLKNSNIKVKQMPDKIDLK